MILNHLQIAELVQRGMVSGHQDDLLNGTSLDVRLANVFKQEVPGKDIKEDEYAMLNLNQREPMNVERVELAYPWDAPEGEAEPLLLYPGQFVLAATMEHFTLPTSVSAEFRLKSSAGRMGLSHALAVWCDPGWHGHLTLELHNISQHHVVALRPGDRIGQMVFHMHEAVQPRMSYSQRGHYNGDVEPEAARASK